MIGHRRPGVRDVERVDLPEQGVTERHGAICVGVGQQAGEFFTAISCNQVASGRRTLRRHLPSQVPQAIIAGQVTVVVVVALEQIDVHQDE